MKIGIYDPYLDSLGGGERYVFYIAKCLLENNEVVFFWNENLTVQAEEKFGFFLKGISFKENIFSKQHGLLYRLRETQKYDMIFFVSDGSIPILLSKKNFLIVQYPLSIFNKGLINRIKFLKIKGIICYSEYVKKYLDKMLPKKSAVLNPYVDPINTQDTKENIILNVGRFTKGANNKKQDVLIEAFKQLCDKGLKDWRLVLSGSFLPSDAKYVENLKQSVGKYPIEIIISPSYTELENLYSKAKIYWHATGYGENLDLFPEKAEHFGISTIEAMSAGVVPVVINAGGLREIVDHNENGLLWNSLEELIEQTLFLIENSDSLRKMSKKAIDKADLFNQRKFCEELNKILKA